MTACASAAEHAEWLDTGRYHATVWPHVGMPLLAQLCADACPRAREWSAGVVRDRYVVAQHDVRVDVVRDARADTDCVPYRAVPGGDVVRALQSAVVVGIHAGAARYAVGPENERQWVHTGRAFVMDIDMPTGKNAAGEVVEHCACAPGCVLCEACWRANWSACAQSALIAQRVVQRVYSVPDACTRLEFSGRRGIHISFWGSTELALATSEERTKLIDLASHELSHPESRTCEAHRGVRVTMPLDRPVSTQLQHLTRVVMSAHTRTRRLVVPIPPHLLLAFTPALVPTASDVLKHREPVAYAADLARGRY